MMKTVPRIKRITKPMIGIWYLLMMPSRGMACSQTASQRSPPTGVRALSKSGLLFGVICTSHPHRRRKLRDDFLGREGKPSQPPLRKVRRQTLNTCLVQPALEVDASFLNESLAPVRRASSCNEHEKNWIIQSRFAVRPLDFRDHIPVRRSRSFTHGVGDLARGGP